jgi:hypothetical protein
MFRATLAVATLATFAMFASGPSQAQVSGTIWLGDTSDNAGACTVCNAANPLQATFTVPTSGINFQINNSDVNTVSQFLNGATLSNPSIGSMTMDNSHVELTGTIGLLAGMNSFVVGHDDGVVLTIVGFGTVVNAPGPTSFSTSPFTVNNPGAAGNFAFTLEYNECCGGPADLEFAINNVVIGGGVPEPSTWAMMLLGFAGLGFAFRQSRRKASFA